MRWLNFHEWKQWPQTLLRTCNNAEYQWVIRKFRWELKVHCTWWCALLKGVLDFSWLKFEAASIRWSCIWNKTKKWRMHKCKGSAPTCSLASRKCCCLLIQCWRSENKLGWSWSIYKNISMKKLHLTKKCFDHQKMHYFQVWQQMDWTQKIFLLALKREQ
jgi:hypothetical protein